VASLGVLGLAYRLLIHLNMDFTRAVAILAFTIIMGSEQLAAARTSAQMQTASTWIDAGYSTDIWNIQDGSLPTLKNISATVP